MINILIVMFFVGIIFFWVFREGDREGGFFNLSFVVLLERLRGSFFGVRCLFDCWGFFGVVFFIEGRRWF